jgi:asparagine synthase (glutamine-hydrolysing)
MCGVVGILNVDRAPASRAVVERMTDSLAHRGPDGRGVHMDGAFGLGHRRLAVIDLTPAACQPMASDEGRYVLAYNGTVYNFRELRRELEGKGHTFRSQSDTEVVLKALAEWGENAVRRFNGMFAFALWDSRERTLLLARDRFGMKPLYYVRLENSLIFASEVKALLLHPDFTAEMDTGALSEYLTFQNFFTDRTLFRDVRMLPAGSLLCMREGRGNRPEPRQYWDFSFGEPASPSPHGETLENLEALIEQAIARQMVADVTVGTYLSGGIDTGIIASVAASRAPNIPSFTIGFDIGSVSGMEVAYDERAKAEQHSALFGTEHYEAVLKAGDMARVMGDLVWHLEEPRVGQSYPNFYAANLASRFCKVVLSGAGGDEMFGGYPWRYYRAAVNSDFPDYLAKYYGFWQRLLGDEDLALLLAPISAEALSPREIFRDVFPVGQSPLSRPEDYINSSMYFEAKTFLQGLLVVEDKLSMAHGLEARAPFLDNDLVDFAQRLPMSCKLGNLGEVVRLNENEPGPKTQRYFERTRDGKLLLRQVMGRRASEISTDGVKQGFAGPDAVRHQNIWDH